MSNTIDEQVFNIIKRHDTLRLDNAEDRRKLARIIAAGLEDAFEARYQEGFDEGVDWGKENH